MGYEVYVNTEKKWNGGSRNEGVKRAKGDYILFMDSDDWLDDRYCLEEIARTIKENNYPDCIRLPYRFIKGSYNNIIMLNEDRPSELVTSIFVAPWTKCVKRDLFVPFPENTMLEDVVQHIAQVDNIESVAVCERAIIVWNRSNLDAISQPGNAHRLYKKRLSSLFRNIADLMDLDLKHDYCIEQRDYRVECYKDIIRNGQENDM